MMAVSANPRGLISLGRVMRSDDDDEEAGDSIDAAAVVLLFVILVRAESPQSLMAEAERACLLGVRASAADKVKTSIVGIKIWEMERKIWLM